MKKTLILFVVIILNAGTFSLFAVPANPKLVERILPDGTKVSYYVRGDERVHWLQSTEGYTLLFDSEQNIVYAEKDKEGNLAPSTMKYGDEKLEASSQLNDFLAKTPKDLRYSESQIGTLTRIWKMEQSAEAQVSPVKGKKKALCVLMGFKDRPFTKTVEEFENLMNQVGYSVGGSKGSIKDYYRENSYGQLDLTVTVVGPYTTKNNASYYCSEYGERYGLFAEEAIRAADADVDFSEFNNGSGALENFHIIFAGYGAEYGLSTQNYIWSHKSQFSGVVLDGVRISVYSCSPELRETTGKNITYIGSACHELCHVFGADDYYDIDDYAYPATGYWDLMDSGCWNDDGRTPSHINMFQKILYGWVEPVELTSAQTFANVPNSAENPVAFTIKPYTNNEQYVLENRQKAGFDQYVPGTGLLIYHIHNSAANGNINNTTHPQQAYVVSAVATVSIPTSAVSSYGNVNSPQAPFGNSGKNEFSGESIPRMFRWNGSSGILVDDKPLTYITKSDDKISFRFMNGIEGEPVFNAVRNIQWSVNNNAIILSWNLPDNTVYPDSFFVYCGDELIGELPVGERTFSDDTKDTGTYTYCVKAVYGDNVSESECTVVEYVRYNCMPVTNLDAEMMQSSIRLTWDSPSNTDNLNYKYALYLGNRRVKDNIENTYYEYVLSKGDVYDFSVIAYSDEKCESEAVNVEMTYIKIIEQPKSATVYEGTEYTLKVVSEPQELDYQWYFNDTPIIGATNNSYKISSINKENAGIYHVVIKSLTGTEQVQSLPASIEVKDLTGIIPVSTNTFTLYPNPVSDVLTIWDDADISSVIITDVNGRTIYTGTSFNHSSTINTSSWSKGIYFVRLQSKNEIKAGKLLKK